MKPKYPMRSLMFVPAHSLRLMQSAIRAKADVLLLDLEDSVPAGDKQTARDNILNFVQRGLFGQNHVFPRVNDRESGELLKDVTQLAVVGIDGFMYPKAQTSSDIFFFDKLLETVEYDHGLPIGSLGMIPLIETTLAVLHAEEMCSASKRVVAIAFGCEDYLADLGGTNDDSASTLFVARSLIAIAARSKGVVPVDTVHIRVHDLDDLAKNLTIAKHLGFEGMLVLHPKELDLVHKFFSPTDEEVSEALQIIEASELSQRAGTPVAVVDGTFIGPPLVRKARQIVERYRTLTKSTGRDEVAASRAESS